MAGVPVKTADEVTAAIRSAIDRALESDVRRRIAERGQELAGVVADATSTAAERAGEAWRDMEPMRRDATKSMERASRDAARWSRRAWRKEVRPALKDAWRTRGASIGAAAGAAVPAGQALAVEAAQRLGLRRRERRHWRAFFIGLIVGAVGGALAALLLTPKPGRQVRQELASKGQEIAERGREAADTLAARARETEWRPLFQRPDAESERIAGGGSTFPSSDTGVTAPGIAGATGMTGAAGVEGMAGSVDERDPALTDGAAEAGTDAGTAAGTFGLESERAGDEAAGAINEAFESPPAAETPEGVVEAPAPGTEGEERPA
jgi:hypothetical protein